MAGPIRQPIPLASLERYLAENTSIQPPLEIRQFGYGQSNPTYLLSTSSGARYVLRKKPPGTLLNPTAHAVEREFRVLSALALNTDVPVPAAICLCEDPAVIGTPFYVMDFVAGRIFEDPAIPGVAAEERAQMWRSALQTLARLHSVDFAKVGLGDFGKVGGFYGRQIRTLGRISKAQAEVKDVDTGSPVGEIPGWMGFMSYFKGSLPQERTAIVHGDYKIDNLVFHPTEPRVVGILDWELSTLGHPLADLCNLLSPYLYAEHPQASLGADPEAFLRGRTPGLPTKEEAVRIYEEAAGWKVQRIKWGEAFMACRNAVITQGITARRARGQASSAHAAEYERLTPELARLARRLVEEDREERAGMVKL